MQSNSLHPIISNRVIPDLAKTFSSSVCISKHTQADLSQLPRGQEVLEGSKGAGRNTFGAKEMTELTLPLDSQTSGRLVSSSKHKWPLPAFALSIQIFIHQILFCAKKGLQNIPWSTKSDCLMGSLFIHIYFLTFIHF